MEYLEFSETIIYRYDAGTFKYEGACIASIDPTTNQPRQVAYSTNIKPLVEPSFGEALYFIDNEWVIKDEYVNGVFYKKSTGEMADKIKVKDLDLYTDDKPALPILEGDQIAYIDGEWVYTSRAPLTLEEQKNNKIESLKNEGTKRIQTINGRVYSDIEWMRKSQNFQDVRAQYMLKKFYNTVSEAEDTQYNLAIKYLDRKDRYVARINEVEASIIAMQDVSEVESIDVTSDELWAGLDV